MAGVAAAVAAGDSMAGVAAAVPMAMAASAATAIGDLYLGMASWVG
eukprot:CAMPEP_0170481306 /NCGR_PEP_ID=MMETSP0208-20121228/1796_1 /TAXON_ID=197538 /ORGANISM="Strombidium inclinatum, Strain S3" /LENGTH=45 /DNA_ID= /DNA_START= /DNA_END= /DNA_ORIENTATION=